MRRTFSYIWRHPSLVSLALFQLASVAILLTSSDVGQFAVGFYIISIFVSLTVFAIVELLMLKASVAMRHVLAAVYGFILAILIVGNAVLHKFFGQFLTAHMLSFVASDPHYLSDYTNTYLLGVGGLALLALAALFYYIWRPRMLGPVAPRPLRFSLYMVGLLAAFLILVNQTRQHGKGHILSMDGSSATAFRSFIMFEARGNELSATKHDSVAALPPTHYNILLVINESWGKKGVTAYGSQDTAMPFLTHWLAAEPESFFKFERAFTNSSATDVSMPSILTGVAPYESFRKLHKMPFLWDWARAAGMRTAYVSAQRQSWANFAEFFFSPGPDFHRTGEDIDAPVINDCGVDDLIAVNTLDSFLTQHSGKHFFAVYNSNALHAPFQQSSKYCSVQASFASKYENAQFMLDKTFEHIYATLKTTGALDSTIIIFTADHGESDRLEHTPRIENFYDEVSCIPFFLYLPASWRAQHGNQMGVLRANLGTNVMNLDIAPTVADLLGAGASTFDLSILHQLLGRSLLSAVDPSRACISLNTNEIRHWDHDGFGVYLGDARFVYSDVEGSRFSYASTDPSQKQNLWANARAADKQQILKVIASNTFLSSIYKP